MFQQHRARILMACAIVSLLGVFLFPVWQISLIAPQFPEYPNGLRMDIWINQISGNDPHILMNVNNLNHYIGMKHIEPDSIPELTYFPCVIYGMIGLGVLAAALNNQWGYLAWAILLGVLGILGIYDFYQWLYDYGHNLDPSAPIQLGNTDYTPPLLGERQIANFYVKSYPALGSAALGFAGVFSALAFLFTPKLSLR